MTPDIDTTISPGDDFFLYANGAWLKRHPIPNAAGSWGIWDVGSDDLAVQLRRISEDAAGKQAPRGSIEQLIGDFWFTGMDSATINRQGLAPLKPDLDRIDRIRSIRDLIDVVAIFHTREQATGNPWYRALFFGHVEQHEKNTDRWIYSLLQSGITLAPAAYASAADPQRARMRQAVREYLFKTFLRLQRDSGMARASADAVYELEARLAQGFDREYGYQKVALADLSRLAPTIDWNRYFRRIGMTGADSVDVRNRRFYQALDSRLRTTPLETWKNYLRFSLIKVNAGLLDDETLGDYFAFDRVSTGALRPRPRWRRVLTQEQNFWLGESLARLYVEQHVPASVKARHQAVGEALRAAFRERIQRLDWMSDSTKRSALLKLARLKITIGFSGDWMDYSTMPLRRDAYVLKMRAGKWFHDLDMKKLSQSV